MRADFGGFGDIGRDLSRHASQADGVVRGALGRTADRTASDAQSIARSKWATHTESADKIRARNARGGDLEAYVISDGRGGYFQERGTSFHPAQPAVQPAFEQNRGTLASEIGKGVDRMLRRRR